MQGLKGTYASKQWWHTVLIIEYNSVDVDNVVNLTSYIATALMLMLNMTKKTEHRYMQLTWASMPTSSITLSQFQTTMCLLLMISETWWWITFKAICKSCRYAQLKTQSAMIMDCIIGSTLIECSDIILFGLARMKMKPRSGIYWLKPCLAVARHWLIDALLVVETKMSCWQYHLQQNERFTKQ